MIFTGLIPKQQVREVIASSDACLVHLRGAELFGTVIPSKIFETMSMNTPIIMGVRGSAREIVLAANAGLSMTPDDSGDLLNAVDRIAAAPRVYQHGRGYVSRFFNRDHLAAEMLDVLARHSGRQSSTPDTSEPAPASHGAKAA